MGIWHLLLLDTIKSHKTKKDLGLKGVLTQFEGEIIRWKWVHKLYSKMTNHLRELINSHLYYSLFNLDMSDNNINIPLHVEAVLDLMHRPYKQAV